MKIIGSSGDKFLAEISDTEIAHILGFDGNRISEKGVEKLNATNYTRVKAKYHYDKAVEVDWVGLVIPISDIYEAARRTAKKWDEQYSFTSAVQFLRHSADELEMLAGAYRPDLEPKTEKKP